jgi:hypothetical protein
MSDNNGWADQPGVPLNPELNRFHWLLRKGEQWPEAWRWDPDADGCGTEYSGAWAESEGDGQPEGMAKWYRYLGPCLTPSEVEARVSDALKWRDAIDDLRTLRWNDPVRNHETPLRAVQRLLNSELTAMALDPAIHKAVKAEITQAKREALEEAARRLEELHKNHNYDPESGTLTKKLGRYDRWPESAKTAKLEHDAGYYRAIAEGVAHIRALKGEGDE